jgi:hypothetical protein
VAFASFEPFPSEVADASRPAPPIIESNPTRPHEQTAMAASATCRERTEASIE